MVGIQVSRGVAFHGLALNCDPDLSWFDHITPCGVEDRGVTSLSQQLGRTGMLALLFTLCICELQHSFLQSVLMM